MAAPSIVQTRNFRTNVEELAAFCDELDMPQRYRLLLSELKTTVLPNLRRFPAMGRLFLARTPYSVEAINALDKLLVQLARCPPGITIREYVMADHLLLYAVAGDATYLLAIRHHKQLSFDFPSFWVF